MNASTGRAYVACQDADHVAVVDEASRRMEAAIPTAISPMAVAGLDNRAFVVSPSAERVYVVEGRQVIQTIPVGHQPAAVAADERSHRVYVANAGDDTLSAIEPTRLIVGATVSLADVPAPPTAIAIDADRGRVYAGQAVVDEGTHQAIGTFTLTGVTANAEVTAEQLALDPASGFLYAVAWNGVLGSSSRRVVYRVDTVSLRQSPAVGAIAGDYGSVSALAVDASARRIYAVATQTLLGETTLAVYDADTGDWVASLPLAVRCQALAVNPTTGHLFLVLAGARLVVLDAATLGTVVSLLLPDEGHAVAVDALYNRVYVTHPGQGSLTIVSDVALPPPPAPANVTRPTPPATPTFTPGPTQPPVSRIPLTPGQRTTPVAPPPRTAAPSPVCIGTPEGPAGALWERDAQIRQRLGCALTPLQPVILAEQPFEHGVMLWRADIRYIYVIYEYGRWAGYQETYSGGPLGTTETPPAGMYAPIRGFGHVWYNQPGVRQKMGWALAPEHGYETVMQIYQRGLVLRDEQGITRILFNDETWRQVKSEE
ncbi:MAG: YncE family protein [Chloroflexi bacterium]|nr:YncE family protein [Chloroflexota bacterium]